MLTELENLFETKKFDEVITNWSESNFEPDGFDDKMILYQILAISSE